MFAICIPNFWQRGLAHTTANRPIDLELDSRGCVHILKVFGSRYDRNVRDAISFLTELWEIGPET